MLVATKSAHSGLWTTPPVNYNTLGNAVETFNSKLVTYMVTHVTPTGEVMGIAQSESEAVINAFLDYIDPQPTYAIFMGTKTPVWEYKTYRGLIKRLSTITRSTPIGQIRLQFCAGGHRGITEVTFHRNGRTRGWGTVSGQGIPVGNGSNIESATWGPNTYNL